MTLYSFAQAITFGPDKSGPPRNTPRKLKPPQSAGSPKAPSVANEPVPVKGPSSDKKDAQTQKKENAQEKPLPEGMVRIDFKEGDIKELIKEFSEILGKNFAYEEAIKGKVTLIGPKEVSKWEARKLFEAALERMGYTVVWGWPINKIMPISKAKTEGNIPVY
jgi:type II secretory pathway component GspD/PulD (secretin)